MSSRPWFQFGDRPFIPKHRRHDEKTKSKMPTPTSSMIQKGMTKQHRHLRRDPADHLTISTMGKVQRIPSGSSSFEFARGVFVSILLMFSMVDQGSCFLIPAKARVPSTDNSANKPSREYTVNSLQLICPFKNPRRSSDMLVTLGSTASSSETTSSSPTSSGVVNLAWTDYYTPDEDSQTVGTPVLFLHGLLGNKRNFASLAKSLGARLDTKRRIVGVDLRNHGESEHSQSMDYEEMAKDVLAFLDSQNLSKVIIVGHSMGGKVAQFLALLTGTQRVEGLCVLDIAPVAYSSNDPHWKAVEEILHAMHSADGSDKQSVDHQLKEAVPDPNLRAFCLTNYGKDSWKIPLDYIVDQLDTLAAFDVDSKEYQGDVFIIHGGQSKFVKASYMQKISQFFPNHMLTTIRGAGHWVHAEAPDDTIALLKRYLDR